ncbi:MAG: CHC2 zinc finger domain-containing protein [Candidatus Moranbacteria bacterium]|nr:CHC2 zinc finger domain-containing protein [Candidatus Moranbacteria bacterium]
MGTDLEEIKSRLNIVDVLGEYLRLDKTGTNYRALCPFHNEKSPSFMVSEEKQIWHCFGCQKGGDIFSFVMEMEGLEFRDALRQLAEKAGVELKKVAPGTVEKKNRTLEILELATKFYEIQLWKGAGKEKIVNYLKERGLTEESIKLFRLGYAPSGWRNVLSFLLNRGYDVGEIMQTGLLVQKKDSEPIRNYETGTNLRTDTQIRSFADSDKFVDSNRYYDRFRDRIIFPICDYSGRVLGYSARVAPGGDESQAKYVNSPETEVYHKSKALYGIDKAKSEIKQKDFALLVEGNMDVIAASQAGIKNVVAVSGTALTPTQLDTLKRYTKNLKMLFDMDAAGEAATKKSLKLALEKNIAVQIVELPFGKDAADVAKNNPEKLRDAISKSKSAMQYLYDKAFGTFDSTASEGKRKISEALLEMIESLASEVEKSHWIKKLAQGLDVTEKALTTELKKAKLTNRTSVSQKTQEGEKVLTDDRQKIDILLEELTGLMLILPDVWRSMALKKEHHDYFFRDKLLKLMLDKGVEFNFDFNRLTENADRELKLRAEKLFFRKKFRLGLNNSLEEVSMEELPQELPGILAELKKETKKIKLVQITKDLKLAENRKDKAALEFLRGEFEKILGE